MKKILLTGFEPFGGLKTNPSMRVLDSINNPNVEKLLLPVSYKSSREILINKISEYKPDIVLSLGLASSATRIRIEKIGVNFQGAKAKDNDGILITDSKISDGPDGLITNFNTSDIIRLLDEKNIPVELSLSAGGYICNTIYYTGLEYNNKNALFIHLPNSKEEDINGFEINVFIDVVKMTLNYLDNVN